MDNNHLVQELTAYYSNKTEVLFGYLFGSHAQNQNNDESDIDIGIYLANRNGEPVPEYKLEETLRLQELFKKTLDLVLINEAPPLLKHEIFSHGILFKNCDPSFLVEYRVDSFYKYLDQSAIINRYFETNKVKIREMTAE